MFFKSRRIILHAQNSFYENKKYPAYPWSGFPIGWLFKGRDSCPSRKWQLPSLPAGKIALAATKKAAYCSFKHRKFFYDKIFDGFYRLFGLFVGKPCF